MTCDMLKGLYSLAMKKEELIRIQPSFIMLQDINKKYKKVVDVFIII